MCHDFIGGSYQSAMKKENMLAICQKKVKLDLNNTEHEPANYTPTNTFQQINKHIQANTRLLNETVS